MIPSWKNQTKSNLYIIKVKENINENLLDWIEGIVCMSKENESIIIGPIKDQSALYGILNKLRDLNLTLLSVAKI